MVRKFCSRFVGLIALVSIGGCTSSGSTSATDAGATSVDSGKVDVSPKFSFFATSQGSGDDGGNLGGLTGADLKCQTAAAKVGAGAKTWHAYLSLSARADGGGEVNARDRIGTGPWYNVRGALIATDVAALHEENDAGVNGITSATGLDENGDRIPTGDAQAAIAPEHDILTGSKRDGRAFPRAPDYTCAGWTSNQAGPASTASFSDAAVGDGAAAFAADGGVADGTDADAGGTTGPKARVGHVDRSGQGDDGPSWNSAHDTPGCAQTDLNAVGGLGRLYCFAID
jgi:hypothetical protein